MTQVPIEGTILWVDDDGLLLTWEDDAGNELTWVGEGGEAIRLGPVVLPRIIIGAGFVPDYGLLGLWEPEFEREGG